MRQILIVISTITLLLVVKLPQQASGHTLSQIISESPSLVLLDQKPINFLAEISARKDELIKFGTQILDDQNGNKVSAIEEDHKSLYGIAREMCRQWLAGKGRQPVSWNTLISVLEQIQLMTLATKIRYFVSKRVTPSPDLYLVEDVVKFLREQYSNQPVIRFDLLNTAYHISFLEITMKTDDDLKVHVPQWQNIFSEPHTSDSIQIPKRLLITGRPGTGKTTLLRYLAKEWAEGRALHFCQVLFLIHLGQLRSRGQPAWNSLKDMLLSAYSDIKDIQKVAFEIAANNGGGACFLFDAHDEWYDDDYVHDLVLKNKLSNSFCILTSRYHEESKYGFNHIEIIGFEHKNLDQYVTILANNHSLTQSVLDLWSKYPDVRHMCTVPLHLAMVVFILRYESMPRIHTRAQIYMAFVNTTIKHYQYSRHPNWNTVSLRHCLLSSSNDTHTHANNLCTAFKYLRLVAFKILFNKMCTFPDEPDIRQSIEKLGFVHIKFENSISDSVRYIFSHPTFLEFFAVLHLITLSRNEQLMYINLFGWKQNNNMVSLYTELVNLYPTNILEEAGVHSFSVNREPFHPVCRFAHVDTTSLKYMDIVTQMHNGELINDFLKLDRITAHSVCIHDIWNYRLLLGDILNLTAVYQIHLRGGNECMNYSVVLEDWNNLLNVSYFDSIHHCLASGQLDDCVQFAKTSVQILSVEGLTSQLCIHILFNIVRNYLPSSFLFEVHTSHIVTENMLMLNNEINSLHGIDVEVTMTVDDCEWCSNVIEQLKLFQKIKGIHIISDCELFAEEIILFETSLTTASVLHLPQYETINITGNMPFLMNLFYGQRHLKHLYLHKVNMKVIYTDWFFQCIENNPYIQTLEIVDSDFGDAQVKQLLKHLPDTLRALNLDHNKLTDNTMRELSLSLKDFHQLNYLSLKHNKITGNGIKLLVSKMKSKRHFHYLDLSSNPIDEQHFTDILQIESLEYLAIDGCQMLNNEILLSKLSQSLHKLQCLHLCKRSNQPTLIVKSKTDESKIDEEKINMHLAYLSCCSKLEVNFMCHVHMASVHSEVIAPMAMGSAIGLTSMWLLLCMFGGVSVCICTGKKCISINK